MTKDTSFDQDNKTVLVDRQGRGAASTPLTDFDAPPRFEQLEERMIYAARLRPAEAFNVGLNSLVAAASELFSEIVRLKHASTREDMNALNADLIKKVEEFQVRAFHNGFENGEVMGACYVLCTVIDETVVTTSWGIESEWSQMSLLSRFHHETFGGERFFRMLDQLSKNPVKHLPMLELMYLCLSLGFEGKYRVQARGMLELEGIRDALHRQIRQVRGDVPRELSPHWQGLSDQRSNLIRIVPAWMVALLTVVCLSVMYFGFAWVLGGQRETVLQPYQSFDLIAAEPRQQL